MKGPLVKLDYKVSGLQGSVIVSNDSQSRASLLAHYSLADNRRRAVIF